MLSNTIQKNDFSPQIDGLRGVAIIFVLLHHCFGPAFRFLWIGVDLFFVLSGFLITRILINSLNHNKYFTNFYFRRVLRIFPLYYLVLFFVLFILPHIITINVDYLKENQIYFWTYTENWLFCIDGWPKDLNIVLGHFWSLAIEEQYYIIWPLLIYMFKKDLGKVIYLILVLIVVSIGCRIFGNLSDPAYYVATHTRVDGLLLGSLVSVLAIVNLDFLNKTVYKLFYVTLSFMVIVLFLPHELSYSNPIFKTVGYTIIALFFATVVALTFSEKNKFNKVINRSFFRFFGKYSYGLYVFHFPVFWIFRTPFFDFCTDLHINHFLGKIITSLLCTTITILLSLLSYKFLELPFLKLKKYFQ